MKIPANHLQAGKLFRLTAHGAITSDMKTPANSPQSITLCTGAAAEFRAPAARKNWEWVLTGGVLRNWNWFFPLTPEVRRIFGLPKQGAK